MDFIISKEFLNENDELVTVTTNCRATLNGKVAEIYVERNGEYVSVITQPWKPNPDGTRSDWVSVEEVVQWIQEQASSGAFNA